MIGAMLAGVGIFGFGDIIGGDLVMEGYQKAKEN